MPFPMISGIPRGTSEELLRQLRLDVVACVSKHMNVKPSWVHPFFLEDMLPTAVLPEEGSSTIYVRLDTAMFHGKPEQHEVAGKVVTELAFVVWSAFKGRFEVECFIGDLDPLNKALLEAEQNLPE